MESIEHGSLFSGIGGFDLAAEWTGWNNAFHCEIGDFPGKILKYYWPRAQHYEDIKKTDFTPWRGRLHVLSGGFPCQGFSMAGKRLGTDDDRYLWPEMLRAIKEGQPPFVIGENVTGILSMEDKSGIYRDVFAQVEGRKITRFCEVDHYEAVYTRQAKMLVNSICEDLEKAGYEVQPLAVPAASVKAPHARERIWFIAYSSSYGQQLWGPGQNRSAEKESSGEREERERLRPDHRGTGKPGPPTNPESPGDRGGLRGMASENESQRKPEERGENHHEPGHDGKIGDAANSNGIRQWGKSNRVGKSKQFGKINSERHDPHTASSGLQGPSREGFGEFSKPEKKIKRSQFAGGITEKEQWRSFPTQSPVCGGNDGLPRELDGITFSKWRNESIKGYGNAVVPQVPLQFFKVIDEFIKTQLI